MAERGTSLVAKLPDEPILIPKGYKPEERERALRLLIEDPSQSASAVARSVGVTPKTVIDWLKDREFRDALIAHKREALDQAARHLASIAGEAVVTLREAMREGGPQAVRAASVILGNTVGAEARIEELEARHAEDTAFMDAFKRAVLETCTHEQAVTIRRRTEEILSGATATVEAGA